MISVLNNHVTMKTEVMAAENSFIFPQHKLRLTYFAISQSTTNAFTWNKIYMYSFYQTFECLSFFF